MGSGGGKGGRGVAAATRGCGSSNWGVVAATGGW